MLPARSLRLVPNVNDCLSLKTKFLVVLKHLQTIKQLPNHPLDSENHEPQSLQSQWRLLQHAPPEELKVSPPDLSLPAVNTTPTTYKAYRIQVGPREPEALRTMAKTQLIPRNPELPLKLNHDRKLSFKSDPSSSTPTRNRIFWHNARHQTPRQHRSLRELECQQNMRRRSRMASNTSWIDCNPPNPLRRMKRELYGHRKARDLRASFQHISRTTMS